MSLASLGLAVAAHLMHTHDRPPPPHPPSPPDPKPEAVCGPVWTGREWGLVWARHREHVGLEYFFARHDADGRPLGEPIEVGWGSHGVAECRLAWNQGRYALVFGFQDPMDSDAELTLVLLDPHGRRVALRQPARGRGYFFEPTSLVPRGAGWRIRFRRDAGAEEEERIVDRDGRWLAS